MTMMLLETDTNLRPPRANGEPIVAAVAAVRLPSAWSDALATTTTTNTEHHQQQENRPVVATTKPTPCTPSCTSPPLSPRSAVVSVARTSSARLRTDLLRKLGIPPPGSPVATKDVCDITSTSSCAACPEPPSILGKHIESYRVPIKTHDGKERPELARGSSARNSQSKRCRIGGGNKAGAADKMFQALGSLWTGNSDQEEEEAAAPTEEEVVVGSNSTSSTMCMMLEDDSSASEEQEEEDSPTTTRRHVHFDTSATVITIPPHTVYSNRIRRTLWESPATMQTNIIRNTLEYTADGWDPEAVVEEEEHYYNPDTKEYIHPVHMEIATSMSLEEQMAVLPANYVNPATIDTSTAASVTTSTILQSSDPDDTATTHITQPLSL